MTSRRNFSGNYKDFLDHLKRGEIKPSKLHEKEGGGIEYTVSVSVSDKPYFASPNKSASYNTGAFQNAVDDLLGDKSIQVSANRGGELFVPKGVYQINDAININATVDYTCKLKILGEGGPRTSLIEQTDPTKDCLSFTTTTGNIRDFKLENITFKGGKTGIVLNRDCYCMFDEVCLTHQEQQAILSTYSTGKYSTFRNSWITVQKGNNATLIGGALRFVNCTFGEDCRGFDVRGNLRLYNCCLFSAHSGDFSNLFGEGNALFRVGSDGHLVVVGGDYETDSFCDTFIFTDHSENVVVDTGEFLLNTCSNVICNRRANLGDKPYPILRFTPSFVSSRNLNGLNYYKQLINDINTVDKNAYISTVTEYKGTVAPYVDSLFLDASLGNEFIPRSRINNN